jgi:calcineurin-like phosphoesterase family protein
MATLTACAPANPGPGSGTNSSRAVAKEAAKPLFAFGLVADCQYRDAPGTHRRYDSCPAKLATSVQVFNDQHVAFVVDLGDIIDAGHASFSRVLTIYDQLEAPRYQVLGNHDFAVDEARKSEVPDTLGLERRYYDFAHAGFRFIVLDGNDISLHAYPQGTPGHARAREYLASMPEETPTWNGAVGAEQMSWFTGTLEAACSRDERVVVFSHYPVFPEDPHNLYNADAVREVIADHNCVIAHASGHNHAGGYGIEDGVHYLTLKAMVDTEHTAFALVEVFAEHMQVRGFGREPDRTLAFGPA